MTLHLHGGSAAAGRTLTPAEGLWDRNDAQLAQDYKGAQRRTVPPLSVLVVYGRETRWKEKEFSMAMSCGCFTKTQHRKDRLISGGSTEKQLLGGGGRVVRSFYKQCTCSSVHLHLDLAMRINPPMLPCKMH